MADLDLGICRSLLLEKRQRTQSVIRDGTLQGGNFAVESVAAFEWNGRQLCLGIGGNFHVDWVATFTWNTQIGHRELFFAAQSGWLPASTGTAQSGRVLVQGGYAACPRDMLAANEIPVRLEVDPRRLWSIPGAPSGIHLGEGRLLWLSPLSLTAVRRLAASTEEQSVRLRNMAKRAGNVGLPNVPLEVDGCAGRMVPPHTAQEAAEAMEATGFLGPAALTLDEGLKRLAESTTRAGRERRPWDLPLGFDPLRGAMTAAAWVAGWSGLVPKPLQSAVRSAWGSQDGKLCIGGINVTLPWPDNPVVGRAVDGEDDAVWTAALEASLRTPDGSGPGESAMISRIRGIMGQMGHLAYASRWAERASQVNRLQASLFDVPGGPRTGDAVLLSIMNSDLDGLAGRLDLWSAGAMSDSVPAQHVEAWYGCVIVAAIQIGWRNGYSRLPVKFRGNEQAQEAVDRKAMAHAWAWDCKGGPPPRPLHEEEWASQLVELPTVSHDHEQAPEP